MVPAGPPPLEKKKKKKKRKVKGRSGVVVGPLPDAQHFLSSSISDISHSTRRGSCCCCCRSCSSSVSSSGACRPTLEKKIKVEVA